MSEDEDDKTHAVCFNGIVGYLEELFELVDKRTVDGSALLKSIDIIRTSLDSASERIQKMEHEKAEKENEAKASFIQVESAIRELDICEVRFWQLRKSFDDNGEPFNVTVTLRGAENKRMLSFNGMNLYEAIQKAVVATAKVESDE